MRTAAMILETAATCGSGTAEALSTYRRVLPWQGRVTNRNSHSEGSAGCCLFENNGAGALEEPPPALMRPCGRRRSCASATSGPPSGPARSGPRGKPRYRLGSQPHLHRGERRGLPVPRAGSYPTRPFRVRARRSSRTEGAEAPSWQGASGAGIVPPFRSRRNTARRDGSASRTAWLFLRGPSLDRMDVEDVAKRVVSCGPRSPRDGRRSRLRLRLRGRGGPLPGRLRHVRRHRQRRMHHSSGTVRLLLWSVRRSGARRGVRGALRRDPERHRSLRGVRAQPGGLRPVVRLRV